MTPARDFDRPVERDAQGLRVAVVVSAYNGGVTHRLLKGALWAFEEAGGDAAALAVFQAPGTFELPALAAEAARTGRYDAVVALGCVIAGETTHDRVIADAAAQALAKASVDTGVPIAFGVLTCQSWEQAQRRSVDAQELPPEPLEEDAEKVDGKAGAKRSNKGVEAMRAAIAAARAMRELHRWSGAGAWSERASS